MNNIFEVLEYGPIVAGDEDCGVLVTANDSYMNLWVKQSENAWTNTDCRPNSEFGDMYSRTAADYWDRGKQCLADWLTSPISEKRLHLDTGEECLVTAHGGKIYTRNGRLHRDGDLPAMVLPCGTTFFYKDGKQHRNGDKPASIYANGAQYWYRYNELHRCGGKPAVILSDGTEEFWVDGERVQ